MIKEENAISKSELKRLFPLCSEIKLVQVHHHKLDSKCAPVTVYEVGRGKISFHSDLLLPVHEHIVWSLQIQYKGCVLTAEVWIAGSRALKSGYLYEARWKQEEMIGNNLLGALFCWIDAANRTVHKAMERYAIFDETSMMNKKIDVFC